MNKKNQFPIEYAVIFVPMFLLGFIARLGNAADASSQVVMITSIAAFLALLTSLCAWGYAAHINGASGLAKGFVVLLLAVVDASFFYSLYKSIGQDTLIGGVVTIIILCALNVMITTKWILRPARTE